MAWTEVTREQFQIFDDHVVHTPTGARFNAYPRSRRSRPKAWAKLATVSKTATTIAREIFASWRRSFCESER